ncbi:MAG: cytidine deaminase [Ruminococcaceae bacterium]|nr:cytidine deaminase [Oscillospiraceae bacterium]
MKYSELLELAKRSRKRAYAPYSGFSVGAALLCNDGSVYLGCNVESASFTPTCCAERVAIFSAVADGKKDFSAIAVVGGKTDGSDGERCMPCGVCRQVMSEFSDGSLDVVLSDGTVHKLCELLPHTFDLK